MKPRTFAIAFVVMLPLILAFLVTERVVTPGWYKHSGVGKSLPTLDQFPPAFKAIVLYESDPMVEFGLPFESVAFTKENGVELHGWYIPAAEETKKGVIGVHGAAMDRREMSRFLTTWHDNGYNVLVFDCQEHGVSAGEGKGISFGLREHEDVLAAVRFVKDEYGWERVALYGSSQGGASVVIAAGKSSDVNVVVSENPFADVRMLLRDVFAAISKGGKVSSDDSHITVRALKAAGALIPSFVTDAVIELAVWRIGGYGLEHEMDPLDFIENITVPILFLHGTADTLVPYHHSEELLKHAKNPASRLWTVENGRHGLLFNKDPEAHSREVSSFLLEHL